VRAAAAVRFQREGIDAGIGPMKWERLWSGNPRPLLQSIVGDRRPLDPADTESVFPQASQIWRKSSLRWGFVETAARREAEENGPPLGGAEEKCLRGSRRGVHEYLLTEKRPPSSIPSCWALVRWEENALLIEEAQPSIRGHVPCGRRR